jgi:hypothetical protein
MIKLNANATFSWRELGEGSPVLIIDDALEEPEKVREHAWKMRFNLPWMPLQYYPGWKSPTAMAGETAFVRNIGTRFLDRLWPEGWPQPLSLADLVPSSAFSVFGLSSETAGENGFIDVHFDGGGIFWIAVLTYLFDNEGHSGKRGTAFWRHRPTGLPLFFNGDLLQAVRSEHFLGMRFIEPLREAQARITANNLAAAEKLIIESKSPRKLFSLEEDDTWGLLDFVEAKFNRTVAYPTWMFHSVVDTTDVPNLSTSNARLTYNTFVTEPFPATMRPRTKYTGGGYLGIEGMKTE